MDKHLGKSTPFDISDVELGVRHLQGKVLTVIDASISSTSQNKAVKDIVKKAFSDQLTYFLNLAWPKTRFLTRDEAESTIKNIDEIELSAKEV